MGSCMSSGLSTPDVNGISRTSKSRFIIPIYRNTRTRFIKKAERALCKSNPDFKKTISLDRLRKREYPSLDADNGHIYLDYTGAGLYAQSQLRSHHELLRRNIFGNPHSLNPTSRAITLLDDQARDAVLRFFNASPEEYSVIFTANASHALKLVGEAYPFGSGGELLLLWDNHNSVHGLREFAKKGTAAVTYSPVTAPELRVNQVALRNALGKKKTRSHRLFAYPAQSNFSGVQHSLEWIETAQSQGWDVLLDAAAFVPTNRLDLTRWHPDFVSISFYKMFGYPSGVGCLIARKSALSRLNRPWFAGGTVWGSSVQANAHVLLDNHEAFEDGTINYLNLPAVHIGLDHLSGIGMDNIHQRVASLTTWLLNEMLSLQHSNKEPVIRAYGPRTGTQRGGTITFNFLSPTGTVVDERIVEHRAICARISLRTGCFCNPGAGEAAFQLSQNILLEAFNLSKEPGSQSAPEEDEKRLGWDDFLAAMGMPSGGGIRVSLGLVSNFADVYRFAEFARTFVDEDQVVGKGLIPRAHC